MVDESNNPSTEGTDTVVTSESDNLDDTWNFFDPASDDEPDTEEAEVEDGTEDEDGETEEQPDNVEPEEGSDEGEESEEEPEQDTQNPGEANADAKVRLADGSETTVGELVQGHMRQSDYTRKSQEVAERRKAVEADASQVEGITQAFVDHLTKLLPPEPDNGLLYSDPTKYYQQRGIYDQALQQVQTLIDAGRQAKSVTEKISQEDQQERLQSEFRSLVEKFPEVGTDKGKQQFFNEAQSAATELGFTPEEFSQATDHRLYALAKWAKRGMDAEKAKKTAREKVEKAPQTPPRKPGRGQGANKNQDAMRRLQKSGSIEDAIAALPD